MTPASIDARGACSFFIHKNSLAIPRRRRRRTGIAPDVHMETQKPGSAPTQYDSPLKGCLPFIIVAVLLCVAAVAVVLGFNVFGPSGH